LKIEKKLYIHSKIKIPIYFSDSLEAIGYNYHLHFIILRQLGSYRLHYIMDEYRTHFYRANLPHLQPLGGTFFVTYNLSGCIPIEVIELWNEEYKKTKKEIKSKENAKWNELDNLNKRNFVKRDKFLDTLKTGNFYLKQDAVAKEAAQSWHFWDTKKIDLLAYCIMPNHVHVVFRLFDNEEIKQDVYLNQIMHSVKGFSAKKCNQVLGLSGEFWQHESYDRLVRNDTELKNIIHYILENPVKANLCKDQKDWKWSYQKP